MSDNSLENEQIEVIYEPEDSIEELESEEEPEAEWSSVLCFNVGPRLTEKQKLYEEGLYHPPEQEICAKYVTMSTSSVLRHPYYKYPAVPDPGIEEALHESLEDLVYDDDGQELYLKICDEMDESPVRLFYHGLLRDEIDLKYYCVSRMGFRPMAIALERNTYVRKLDFTDNFMNNDACYHLSKMLITNRTIEHINLNGCRMGPEGCRILLDELYRNFTLKKLNLARNALTDTGMAHVAFLIQKGTSIDDFNFSFNNVTSSTALYLSEAFEINNFVKRLDFSWNSIQVPRQLERMCTLFELNNNLVEVNFAWNGLSNRHSGAIAYILKAPNLETFYLNNNRLTGAVIDNIISCLTTSKKLVTLDMSYNPLTTAEARALLFKMRLRSLKLNNLILDGVTVTQSFIIVMNRILNLKHRKNAYITYGYVLPANKVILKDMKDIVFTRAQYLCSKPKKNAVHIGLIILKLHRLVQGEPIGTADQLPALIRLLGVSQLSSEFIKQMGSLFPSPPPEKEKAKRKYCNVTAMANYVKRKWPDLKLPPPTPPIVATPTKPPVYKTKRKKRKY